MEELRGVVGKLFQPWLGNIKMAFCQRPGRCLDHALHGDIVDAESTWTKESHHLASLF